MTGRRDTEKKGGERGREGKTKRNEETGGGGERITLESV